MRRLVAALAVLLPVTGLARLAPAVDVNRYTVLGVVNAAGRNNTRFVSDLALTNPGSSPADVILSFVPGGVLEDQEVSLSRGKTIVWRNVLQQLWGGAEASGAVVVRSDQPLLVRARTYNTAATGTFGVALPALPDDELLGSGDRAHCLWVSQSPDGAKDFRTNIAVAFPDAGGGRATVTLYDQGGVGVGTWKVSSDVAGFQQVSVGGVSGPLPEGRAEIEVRAGRAAAYASVVDNVTGDSSLFPFEPLPAGAQDVLVNGVARANGKNDTFFRTDGRFYNAGEADAKVIVAFHANQGSNPSPATSSFTVPAGRILDVTDVLGTLLGLPVGSSGALRFQSDSAVGIRCRTSNVDPSGAKPGTFGAQQKPVPLLSFLSSADAGALVSGIRQNPGYRTNVGLAAGADGATYQLTLKSAQGATVGAVSRSLGPFGWEQPGIDKIFNSIPDDAQLLVKVTSGSVDVYDSSVDNGSGDSVVTPAQALPANLPSSSTIGPEGGSVRSDDGRLTVKVPAGALSVASIVSLQTVPNVAPDGVGSGYSLNVIGASFRKAPLASLSYSARDLVGSGAEYLLLAFQSAGALYALQGSSCDTTARTISAPLAGVPVAGSATPSAGAQAVVEADTGGFISPILYFSILPGKAGVLAGGIVNLQVTGFTRSESGKLTPKDFSFYSKWELLPSGSAPGELNSSGGTASYVAPPTVACVEPITVSYQFHNPDGMSYRGSVPITLLPRQWELSAVVAVEADLCKASDDSPRFELMTDKVKVVMTLVEDPAGKGFQFMPAAAGEIVSKGSLGSVSFCPSKECRDAWSVEPTTDLTFHGGIGEDGGWDNSAGRFYLRNFGLVLGHGSPYRWGAICPSDTRFFQQMLPNLGYVDPWNLILDFDPPDPEYGCVSTTLIRWEEWQSWIGVHTPRKNDIYYGTGFMLTLRPK